jgi:hypothetical protein
MLLAAMLLGLIFITVPALGQSGENPARQKAR